MTSRLRRARSRVLVGNMSAVAHAAGVDILVRGLRPYRWRLVLGTWMVRFGVKVTGMKLRTFRVRYD